MLRDIIRKEIMDNISTLKFVVTFVVVIVLIISGLVIGSRNYLEQRGDVIQQRLLNLKMLESQNDWFSAGWTGVIESKKPYVLTTIDNGIDNSLGRQATVDTLNESRLDNSRNQVSPILAVFGDVDLTFVVKIILSLFVILLTYDSISGEKEYGTLKLMLSNEVPRWKILLGKIFGGSVVILISFLLPLLLGLAFMMGFQSDVLKDFTPDAWWRFAMIVLVYLFYLAVFFAVGLMVSSMCKRSATSFIVLLMIWVLFVTIIPRLSLTASERIKSYESYTALQTKAFKEVSEKRGELYKEYMPKMMQQQQMLAMKTFNPNYQAPPQKQTLAELQAEFWDALNGAQRDVMERYDSQYERQQADQINFATNLSRFISPASSMSFAVQTLSGSGWERQKDYIDQLRKFRRDFMQYIYDKGSQVQYDDFWAVFEASGLDIDLQQITFNYREESLSSVMTKAIVDSAVLLLMTILFFTISFVLFIRYDVR